MPGRIPQTIPRVRNLPRDIPESVRQSIAEVIRVLDLQGRMLQKTIRSVNENLMREGVVGGEGGQGTPTSISRGTLLRDFLTLGG